MKLLKKVSVTAVLVTVLAFATACSGNNRATREWYEQAQSQKQQQGQQSQGQQQQEERSQEPQLQGQQQQQQEQQSQGQQQGMTAQERYEAMNAAQANVTSMEASIIMEMDISLGGERTATVTEMRMTSFAEPFKAKMEMNIDMGALGNQAMETYVELTENNTGMIYLYDGTAWTSQEMADITSMMEQYDARNSVGAYVDGITDLAEAGREQVNGRETIKLTGVFTGEMLKESIMETGSLDSLQGMFTAEQLNHIYDGLENENSHIEIWVDANTNEMVKYTQDMTSAMNKIYQNMSALLPEGQEYEMSVGRLAVTIEGISYNNAADFEIPAEAKQ